ncbi:MAG: hypothetical protein JWM91_1083 [Rhodospirillales bacterium]|nr:hypothetical protein [Rhodospirillales bacterium]
MRATARLNTLECAICSTIAYFDVFDFPVTLLETHRYLHGMRCGPTDILQAVSSGMLIERYLECDGEYFALRGRSALFEVRRVRQDLSQRQWKTARLLGRFLATLPNVRMVAMTGSLAAGNFAPGGDIDFLLITDAGTMWRTRALCRVLARLDDKLGKGLFCPNTFLSAAALRLPRKSLYDAQELSQMIPLFGLVEYEAVRRANAWTEEWLPNAAGPPSRDIACEPLSPGLKRCGEWLLDSAAGQAIENFEASRKIHRFNDTDHLKGAWTRSTRESHSMWDEMRLKIEKAWRDRVDAIASE